MYNSKVKEIDLHGYNHYDAVNMVEDIVLNESRNGSVTLHVITGNSPKLKEKLINEVCKRWDLNYSEHINNPGVLIIEYIIL